MTAYFILALGYMILFGVSFQTARRDPFKVLSLWLIALLPHELVLRWLRNLTDLPGIIVTGVSLWKEVVLAALVLAVLLLWIRKRPQPRALKLDWFWGSLIAITLISVLSVLFSSNLVRALAALREYFEPMLVFGIVLVLRPSKESLSKLLRAWLIVGVMMAALGIWQGISWQKVDYVRWGFGDPSGQIGIPSSNVFGDRYIRPPSTVSGPNELAMHMALLLLFTSGSFFEKQMRRRWLLIVGLAMFASCLIMTFSRSTLLGLIVGGALLLFFYRNIFYDLVKNRPTAWIAAVVLGTVAAALLATKSGMFLLIKDTVLNLKEEYHIRDIAGAIQYLVLHPEGVGMGFVGPRQGFFFPQPMKFSVEGSLFQIAMEMGVWGLFIWLIFWFLGLQRLLHIRSKISDGLLKTIVTTAFTGWVTALIVFLFLPLMQSLTLMSWLWFFFGTGLVAKDWEESWEHRVTKIT
jgi:hypothetical protein